MKRKTTYSIIITMILMGSLIPLQTQALADVIQWHSSLDDGIIAWRIIDQSLFDQNDPPTLAGEDIYLGSVIAFEINDTLPTLYDDVYSSGLPPNFFKLFVDYTEVSLYDVNSDTEPSLALQYMILPNLFFPAASGETLNITQFLEHRAALDPNITAIDYVITGGNYVQVSIYNDYIDSFIITVNNQTGIVADFFIEDDFGEMYGQLDIWESSIDDEGTDITNTLNFHPSIGDGTVLSWEFTEIVYAPASSGVMEVNNKTIGVGDFFKFEYGEIPDDPLKYYGGEGGTADSFFNVFFEEEPVRWENITRAQLVIWVTMLNPLSCTLYNGTIVNMEALHNFRDFMDPGIDSTTATTAGDYMTLSFEFTEGEADSWSMSFEINVISGIVHTLNVGIPDFVDFEMVFYPINSSLLIDGSVNPNYPPTNNSWTLPGFNWFYLIFSAIVILPLVRRRKK